MAKETVKNQFKNISGRTIIFGEQVEWNNGETITVAEEKVEELLKKGYIVKLNSKEV